jgi:hypothetical protein
VVGTHGRGIYIAGIGPAEEFTDSLLAQPVVLFDVAPAYQFRWHHTRASDGSAPYMASNPPRGAVISYYIREPQAEGVKLVITSASGDTVRTITGSGVPGLQRVTWDLSSQRPRPRALGEPTERAELVRVLPGTYTVHLTMGEKKLERTIVVTELGPDKLGRIR